MLRHMSRNSCITKVGIVRYDFITCLYHFMVLCKCRLSRYMHTFKRYCARTWNSFTEVDEKDIKYLERPEMYCVRNIMLTPRSLATIVFDISTRLKFIEQKKHESAVITFNTESDCGNIVITPQPKNYVLDQNTQKHEFQVQFGENDNPSVTTNRHELMFLLTACTYTFLQIYLILVFFFCFGFVCV